MWLLTIIVLTITPPYESRGIIAIPYANEVECIRDKEKVLGNVKFDKHNIRASCSFRGYLGN